MAFASFNKMLLSTGNIMSAGAEFIRRPTNEKSNLELLSSLNESFTQARTVAAEPITEVSSNTIDSWTTIQDGMLCVPDSAGQSQGLSEDRSEYDVTVKLFYLPNVPPSARCAHTREALELVLKELSIPSVDLLIISFPNISFDADDDTLDTSPSDAEIDEWTRTYRTLEDLQSESKIARIGLSEFGTVRLSKILPHVKVKPSVNQINVRDCCVVPKPLIIYARGEGIELLTHNDCTDIMPRGSLRELMTGGFGLVGEDKELTPLWVVKYTAVVKDRGVIEDKGYFVMAGVENK